MPDKKIFIVGEAEINKLLVAILPAKSNRAGIDVAEDYGLAVLGILLLETQKLAIGKMESLTGKEAAVIVDHKVEFLILIKLDIAVGDLTVKAKGLVAAGGKGDSSLARILYDIAYVISALNQGVSYVELKAVGINRQSALILRESELDLAIGFRNQGKLLVSAEAVLQNSKVAAVVYHTVKATEGEQKNCASCPLSALILPGALYAVVNNAANLGTEGIDLNSGIFVKNLVNHNYLIRGRLAAATDWPTLLAFSSGILRVTFS